MRTTNKSVVNKLQAHVLDSFGIDDGWDTDDSVANLKEQLKSFDYLPSEYQRAKELVMGGTFLCYHYQVREFLNSLDIQDWTKHPDEYDNQQQWDLYVHLLSREICKLINQ